MPNMTFGL